MGRTFADPQTGVAKGRTFSRNMRSKCRCSMCPAIHINSRSWLRSSSTHEPSDPPPKVITLVWFFCFTIQARQERQIPSQHRSIFNNQMVYDLVNNNNPGGGSKSIKIILLVRPLPVCCRGRITVTRVTQATQQKTSFP